MYPETTICSTLSALDGHSSTTKLVAVRMNDLVPGIGKNAPTPHLIDQFFGLGPVFGMSFQECYNELVFLEAALDYAVADANLLPRELGH
jgi:hypothetical protein